MAYISKLTIGGTTYDIYDAEARAILSQVLVFVGVTTVALTDGATSPSTYGGLTGITIPSGKTGADTVDTGTVVIYSSLEFVWDGSKWAEFGDLSEMSLQTSSASFVNDVSTSSASFLTSVSGSPTNESANTGAGTSHSHTMSGTTKHLYINAAREKLVTATQSANVLSSVAKGTLSTTSTSNGDGVVASLDTAKLVTASVTPAAVGTGVTVVTGMASNPYYASVAANADGTNTNTLTLTSITPSTASITPAVAGTAFTYATGALSSDGSGSTVAYSGTTKYLELGAQSVTVEGTVATGALSNTGSGSSVVYSAVVAFSTASTVVTVDVLASLSANTGVESAHTHTYSKTSQISLTTSDATAITGVTTSSASAIKSATLS